MCCSYLSICQSGLECTALKLSSIFFSTWQVCFNCQVKSCKMAAQTIKRPADQRTDWVEPVIRRSSRMRLKYITNDQGASEVWVLRKPCLILHRVPEPYCPPLPKWWAHGRHLMRCNTRALNHIRSCLLECSRQTICQMGISPVLLITRKRLLKPLSRDKCVHDIGAISPGMGLDIRGKMAATSRTLEKDIGGG